MTEATTQAHLPLFGLAKLILIFAGFFPPETAI
jgi:hypothetical protein